MSRRLKALALMVAFAGGPGLAVAVDLAHHHSGHQESHSGRHVEHPGACPDDAHACDLGLNQAGPRLPVADQMVHVAAVLAIRPAVQDADPLTPSSRHALPTSRAPPLH